MIPGGKQGMSSVCDYVPLKDLKYKEYPGILKDKVILKLKKWLQTIVFYLKHTSLVVLPSINAVLLGTEWMNQ